MNEQVTPEGGAMPFDANASQAQPTTDVEGKPGSEADSSPAATEPSEAAKPKKGEDQRYGELTRRWREEQRRSDRLLAMLEKERTERAQAPEQPRRVAKTPADFNNDYVAHAEYVRQQTALETAEAVRKQLADEQKQQEAEREAAKRQASYRKKAGEFAKTAEDYYDVAGSYPASDAFVELVMELDDAPLVAYHLGNNHDIAEKLGELPERRLAIELGRLEARLVIERDKLKAKPVSQAPPPAPKIEAVDPGDTDTEPNSTWSDAKFKKWRERQIAQR